MRTAPGLGSMFDAPRARAVAGAWAALVVALDMSLFATNRAPSWLPRTGIALIALLVAAMLSARDPRGAASLGLGPLSPEDRRWWMRIGLVSGGVCVAGLAALAIITLVRREPLYQPPIWGSVATMFAWGVVITPLVEEIIYRLTLLPAAVALFGPRAAFVVGALLFALLHFIYGNLDPSNVFGSIVLTWAFVRSGSLAVTFGLHAAGNAVLITAHVLTDRLV